jgi:hypothetical protein
MWLCTDSRLRLSGRTQIARNFDSVHIIEATLIVAAGFGLGRSIVATAIVAIGSSR